MSIYNPYTRTNWRVTDDLEPSPELLGNPWIDSNEKIIGVETPEEIILKDEKEGTLFQIKGMHPASIYVCQVVELDGRKQIKVWHGGRNQAAVTMPESFISYKSGSKAREKGVLRLLFNYYMPNFNSVLTSKDQFGIELDHNNTRTEPYVKLWVKRN